MVSRSEKTPQYFVLGSKGLPAANSPFKSNKRTVWLLLLLIAAVVAFAFWPVQSVNLTAGQGEWAAQGCFQQGSVSPTTSFDTQISKRDRRGVTLWGSYCGSGASTGNCDLPRSGPYLILELFVAGHGGDPGLELFLERQDDKALVALPQHQPASET